MLRKLLTLETITEEPKDLYLVELDDSEYKGTLAQEGILGDMKDKIGKMEACGFRAGKLPVQHI